MTRVSGNLILFTFYANKVSRENNSVFALLAHIVFLPTPYSHSLSVLYELAVGDILQQKCTTIHLSEALRGNTQIKRVTFREYSYPQEHINIILDALVETRVHKISVGPQSQILAYDGRYAMAVSKKAQSISSLVKLDLNMCKLGPTSAVTLAGVLASNRTLSHVMLQECQICDEGAVAIGYMLKHKNRTLKEVILDTNNISSYGQMALRNAIYDDSSFSAMEKSNHVLQSYFYNPRSVFGPVVMNDVLSSNAANLRSKSGKTAITKKLKRMLQKKYKVKLHFDTFLNTETEVMPNVLGWMTTKCDLDMVYAFRPILMQLLEGVTCGAKKSDTVADV